MTLTRSRTKRKPSPLKAADDLFSKMVRDRDEVCQRCGIADAPFPHDPQCAHIWSRRYRALRWRLENAIRLCRGCHMYFTHRPAEWAEWCEAREFCEHGISTQDAGHLFDTFTYAELRHRALHEPPEKLKDALVRLREAARSTSESPWKDWTG